MAECIRDESQKLRLSDSLVPLGKGESKVIDRESRSSLGALDMEGSYENGEEHTVSTQARLSYFDFNRRYKAVLAPGNGSKKFAVTEMFDLLCRK